MKNRREAEQKQKNQNIRTKAKQKLYQLLNKYYHEMVHFLEEFHSYF